MSSCFINQDDNVCVQKYVNKLHNSLHFLCLLICLIGKAHTRLYSPNRQSNKISKPGKICTISFSLSVCVYEMKFSAFFSLLLLNLWWAFFLQFFCWDFLCMCVCGFMVFHIKRAKARNDIKTKKKRRCIETLASRWEMARNRQTHTHNFVYTHKNVINFIWMPINRIMANKKLWKF